MDDKEWLTNTEEFTEEEFDEMGYDLPEDLDAFHDWAYHYQADNCSTWAVVEEVNEPSR